MMEICTYCRKEFENDQIVKTDEFNEYGSEVKNYCPDCFLKGVKHGFENYEIGNCRICKSPLIPLHDDEELISQAQEDFTVHFVCEKMKTAIENGHQQEIERLEQEEHDFLITYTIQPPPGDPDFG